MSCVRTSLFSAIIMSLIALPETWRVFLPSHSSWQDSPSSPSNCKALVCGVVWCDVMLWCVVCGVGCGVVWCVVWCLWCGVV